MSRDMCWVGRGYNVDITSDMASWVHLCSNDLHFIVSRPKKPEALFSTCIAALLHGTVKKVEDIRKIMRFFSDTQYYTFSNANNYRAKEL